MPYESSQHRNSGDEIELRSALVRALESGRLDHMECPNCREYAITVWFSNPIEGEYRTWFICSSCSFEMRVQNSMKPRFYSDERVSHELDQYDRRVLALKRMRSDRST